MTKRPASLTGAGRFVICGAYWIISEHMQAVHDRYQARPSRTPEALIPTTGRPLERMRFNIHPHTTSKDPR